MIDIVIVGDWIVGIYGEYDGVMILDGEGKIVVLGFIDMYLYVEFFLVILFEFDWCVLFYGVIIVVCDLYEIVNVFGVDGICYFLDSLLNMVMDLCVNLFFCVFVM